MIVKQQAKERSKEQRKSIVFVYLTKNNKAKPSKRKAEFVLFGFDSLLMNDVVVSHNTIVGVRGQEVVEVLLLFHVEAARFLRSPLITPPRQKS